MGCDIHMQLERRVVIDSYPEGIWQNANQFTGIPLEGVWISSKEPIPSRYFNEHSFAWWNIERRNYEFFAALAGVRGDGPDPKGLPEGVSPMTQAYIDSWGADGHSHSWGYADEIMSLYFKFGLKDKVVSEVTERILKGDFGPHKWAYLMDRFVHSMPTDPQKPTDWRFIYFFDN